MLCVPVLIDHIDCPPGRQDRAFLPSADMAERLTAKLEWAVGLVALQNFHHRRFGGAPRFQGCGRARRSHLITCRTRSDRHSRPPDHALASSFSPPPLSELADSAGARAESAIDSLDTEAQDQLFVIQSSRTSGAAGGFDIRGGYRISIVVAEVRPHIVYHSGHLIVVHHVGQRRHRSLPVDDDIEHISAGFESRYPR
jgi:hypothetical protein